MKRKFILIFSMLTLVACLFSISVFATNCFDESIEFEDGLGFTRVTSFDTSANVEYGVVSFYSLSNTYCGFINIEWWHSFFSQYEVTDAYSLGQAINEGHYEDGILSEDIYSVFNDSAICDSAYKVYNNYLTDLNTPTYEDGLKEGQMGGTASVNLIDPSKMLTYSVKGGLTYSLCDVEENSGAFTISGTCSSSESFGFVSSLNHIVIQPGTYIFSGKIQSGITLNLKDDTNDKSHVFSGNPVIFTIEKESKIRFNVLISPNIQYDKVLIKPTLIKYDVVDFGTEQKFTQYDIETEYYAGFESGKITGVNEFKGSTEYRQTLNNEYTNGKTAGVEAYKSSADYENALAVKYSTGLADGKSNYIESNEYAEILKAEYDEGYQAGNDEANKNNLVSSLLSLAGTSLLGFVIVWIVKKFSRKRKRR